MLYSGCCHHGHIGTIRPIGPLSRPCPLLPSTANESTLNFRQQSFGSLFANLNRQINYFTSEKIHVNHVWECEWLELYGPLSDHEKVPSERLIPREGLR